MKAKGKVWKYGDDVNTDVIFPGKYTYTVLDPSEMGKYALEDLDPEFAHKAQPGDVIVAGKNWGCGSSREQAATCLTSLKLGAVIARSFARIFYRNAINQGLPVIQSPEAVESIEAGELIEIDFEKGLIMTDSGKEFSFAPIPEYVRGILQDGGLVEHIRKSLGLD